MRHELSSKEVIWVNVQSPETDELAEFIRDSGLSSVDAEFVAQNHHRPSVTARQGYILILVQVPVFDRKLRLTQGAPFFMIAKEQTLYTLHYDPIIALDKARQNLDNSPEWQEELFSEGPLALGLDLLSQLNEGAFRKLERLAKHVDIAEDAVFQGNERKMVEEVSMLTRDVMDFRKVIRPQQHMFATLPRQELLTADITTSWSRIDGQYHRMWDMLESMIESVRELSNTNFTLLQHKENELLRLLTIYSIVVIPMLVLTDPIFNPRADDATILDNVAFWTILAILVLVLIGILVRVKRKRLW